MLTILDLFMQTRTIADQRLMPFPRASGSHDLYRLLRGRWTELFFDKSVRWQRRYRKAASISPNTGRTTVYFALDLSTARSLKIADESREWPEEGCEDDAERTSSNVRFLSRWTSHRFDEERVAVL